MKKLVLVFAALTMASVSQAALLFCASNVNTTTNSLTTNPTNIGCGAIDVGAGNTIGTITIRLLGSFNDTVENTIHQVQFSATNNLTAAVHSVTTASGDFSGSGGPTSGTGVAVGTQTFGASTVAITTTNVGGAPTPDNTSIAVWLDYTVVPTQTGIPEPSTMALLGSALVGLGLISRRK